MIALDIVGVAFGILGRITEGVSQAIAAAQSKNEDEAFDILERAIAETGAGIVSMRAKLKANREAALRALADKFPSNG